MLTKTNGIVFRYTRYGDTSIIVNVFTEVYGLQSYIVNGVRSSSAKGKIALFQPLTLLEMVVYYKENAAIKRIKEVKCLYPYHSLPNDVRKSSIAMFLNELLNKTVKDESHAHDLYSFIAEGLMVLDETANDFENFHLVFMIRLSRLLGFGAYSVQDVLGLRIADQESEQKLALLLEADFTTKVDLSIAKRRILLDILLKFYQDHLDTLGEFKSVAVLKEVLSD
jgi:DNA repair protein RecO (recombination protein O)